RLAEMKRENSRSWSFLVGSTAVTPRQKQTQELAAEPRPWQRIPSERAQRTMSGTGGKEFGKFRRSINASSFSMVFLTLSGTPAGKRQAAPSQDKSRRCWIAVLPGGTGSLGYSYFSSPRSKAIRSAISTDRSTQPGKCAKSREIGGAHVRT